MRSYPLNPLLCIRSDMYQRFGAHRLLYRPEISKYVKAGLLDKAIQVFDEMTQSNCRVFSLDYNQFIGALVRQYRFELAEHYYYKMIPQGFSLTPFTYSRFISGLCEIKNFSLIEKLLDDKDKLGCLPDIGAFNICLLQNRLEMA
ncbi:Pentatricopeptide repeat [Quillaja saponaria]|uniref:Pentatricopeptide repeat n=1 Tax=Quillaja saponaria TaxID=32244 RepID=A0AAD7P805_QUISA|nr:Pentatricopeptide repeat [Quillaja saponaria]